VGFDYLGRQQVKNVAAPVTSYRVTLNGTTEEHAGIVSEVATPPTPEERALRRRARFPSNWFSELPRPVAAVLVISGFLFLVNVFSGLHEVWFHWPTAAMLLIAGLWMVLRRKPARETKEHHRTGHER
jgi:adenylate cyclase